MSKISFPNAAVGIVGMLCILASAQKVEARTDSVSVWRFVYEGYDVNFKDRDKDLLNLDVRSDGSSFFYSIYDMAEQDSQTAKSSKSVLEEEPHQTAATYRVLRENNEIVCVTTDPDNFYFKEADPGLDWEIADRDTMTVCGYVCKRATASYAGRTWTAWFAEEIISDIH